MTFAQMVAAASGATHEFDWQSVSEGLGTVLLGLLAFMGRRVLHSLDAMSDELRGFYARLTKSNDETARTLAAMELRVGALENISDRRRKPRRSSGS